MRILTQKEQLIFETAFNCICRVAAVTHTTQNLHEIKIKSNRESKHLSQAMRELFYSKSLEYSQGLFCLVNKERAIEYLIDRFTTYKIQPKEYIFTGLLCVERVEVAETIYSDERDVA